MYFKYNEINYITNINIINLIYFDINSLYSNNYYYCFNIIKKIQNITITFIIYSNILIIYKPY